jgi:UDPglucose 6-dehydrogenase/GDP-mannose 6-dehydrogenase
MRVAIVGTGYVGLVSGACLADIGHEVVCVDIDKGKVDRINAGKSPLHENGLDEIIARNIGRRFSATTDLSAAFAHSDLSLVCVGTPFDGRRIDLQYVLAAARQIGGLLRNAKKYHVVTIKSTVVPGTTAGPVREALEKASGKKAGVDFGLGMNPEFLSEGVAVREFMAPDRIVVGGVDQRSRYVIARLYESFKHVPIIHSSPTTAEMIKYASNSLLATLISFSNEIALYCEAFEDVDVVDVFGGVHQMRHLVYENGKGRQLVPATSFLWPGCGFGGSCFPKDVKALVAQAQDNEVPSSLLKAVLDINARQPDQMIKHLLSHYPSLEGRTVAVLGLAFKPDTDDVRESPALRIVPGLLGHGAKVVCHDPIATANAKKALADSGVDLGRVEFRERLDDAVSDCEAVLLVTKWAEYARLPKLLATKRPTPLLVDGRRFIARADHPRYAGIGLRPQSGT